MKSLTILAFLSTLAFLQAFGSPLENDKILDCITNPCLTVPGVGKLKGTKKSSADTGRNIYSYYSIPYGKPTSGDLRFAPPVTADPVNDGEDIFDATYVTYLWNALGRVCPQVGVSLKGSYSEMISKVPMEDADGLMLNETIKAGDDTAMAGSEDCLHLAVFTPKKASEIGSSPLLPVMFFIHGGAFYMGTYLGMGPKELLEKDVVLVEIQYRLGPLGFMCLDNDEAAGNMGMLDQALALEWVKEHIAGFGGNPDDITIFGESAGSASVSYHLLSPRSRDNFQKVIGQSGSALAGWAFDNEPEKHAKEIATRLNCPTDNLDDMIRCMKYERTAQEIVSKHNQYIKSERYDGRMGFGGSTPCAQTKGKEIFIDKHPEEYLRQGDFSPKPAFFGANKHEGSFVLGVMYNNFIILHGHQHNENFLRHEFIPVMLDALGLNDASGVIYEILEHDYFNLRDVGEWDRMMPGMINLVGTFFIKAATHEFMKYNSLRGAPSYFYSFEYEGESSIFNLLFTSGNVPPLPHGVTHGDDLIYLFSTGLFTFTDEDTKIRKQMVELWTNFAIYGEITPADHQVKGIPNVPKWDEESPVYLKIDSTCDLRSDYVSTWDSPNIENGL